MTDPLFVDLQAEASPEKPAYVMARSGESVTYRELTDRSRQAAHAMRALGAARGTAVAIMMENHLRYLEIAWAAQRAGLRYTTISPRLTVDEVAYILDDSAARLLFVSESAADVAVAAAARAPGVSALICVDGPRPGVEDYDALIGGQPAEPLPDEAEGVDFLYSSGTTGRPKAIKTELPLTSDRDAARDRAAVRAAVRIRSGHRVPLAGAALSLSAVAIQHGGPAARRHDRGDGQVRRRVGARADRALSRHPHPDGPDDVRAAAPAACGERATVRRVLPARGRPCGGAVPGRRQEADDRVARADHLRVLLGDRDLHADRDRLRGLARAPGLGRAVAGRHAPHPRRRRQRAAGAGGRHDLVRGRAELRVPQRSPTRPPTRATDAAGRPSETSATSTKRATST